MLGESRYAEIIEHEDDSTMDEVVSLDHIIPSFHQPHPWHRGAQFEQDFILLCEFCELEGPKPLKTIPKDAEGSFDTNRFVLQIMAVDQTSNSGFTMSQDTPVVMSDFNSGIFSYVHHFTLFDIQARGFIRTFCMVYVTSDQHKLIRFHEEMVKEFNKVSQFFKLNNVAVFKEDLEKHLTDLDYTKEKTVDYQLSVGSGGTWPITFSPSQLSLLKNQSVVALSEAYNEVLDIYRKLTQQRKNYHESSLSTEGNLLNWWNMSDGSSATHTSDTSEVYERFPSLFICQHCAGSSLDNFTYSNNTNYKPRLVQVGVRKFETCLRSLNELCPLGARKGLQRLHCIQKYFSRDLVILEIEKSESFLVAPPSSAALVIGQCVQVNFLHHVYLTMSNAQKSKSPFVYALDRSQSLESYISTHDDESALAGFETFVTLPPFSSSLQRNADTNHNDGTNIVESGSKQRQILSASMSSAVFSFRDNELSAKSNARNEVNKPTNCKNCDEILSHDDSEIHRHLAKPQPNLKDALHGCNNFCLSCKAKIKGEMRSSGMVINPGHCIKRIYLDSERGAQGSRAKFKPDKADDAKIPREKTEKNSGEDNKTSELTSSSNKCLLKLVDNGDIGDESLDAKDDVLNVPRETQREQSEDDNSSPHTGDSSGMYETASLSDDLLSDESGSVFYDATCEGCENEQSFERTNVNTQDVDTLNVGTNRVDTYSVDTRDVDESSCEKCPMKTKQIADDACSLCKRGGCQSVTSTDVRRGDEGEKCDVDTAAEDDSDGASICSSLLSGNRSLTESVATVSDHVTSRPLNDAGQRVVFLLNQFANIELVITSLLIGRPVVVIGNHTMEHRTQEIVKILSLFLPGQTRLSEKLYKTPLRLVDLVNEPIIAMCRPERKCFNVMITRSIQRYVTILDIEKNVIIAPSYQSATVNVLLKNKKAFSNDSAFIAFFHGVMSRLGRKAFVLYHCESLQSTCPHHSLGRCEASCSSYKHMVSSNMKKLSVNPTDAKILLWCMEKVKLHQLASHFLEDDRGAETSTPFLRLEMENCQVFKC